MIVLEVSILQPGSQVGSKIGNPTSLGSANQQRAQGKLKLIKKATKKETLFTGGRTVQVGSVGQDIFF